MENLLQHQINRMPSGPEASFRPRQNLDYDQEKEHCAVTMTAVKMHPLHPHYKEVQQSQDDAEIKSTQQEENRREKKKDMTTTINADFDDPLSMMLRGEITSVVNRNTTTKASPTSSESSGSGSSSPLFNSNSPALIEYEKRKKTILTECTLIGRINVTTTDLTKIGSGDVDIKHALSLSSNRLAQLEKKMQQKDEDMDEDTTRSYTQEEYTSNLNSLKNQITKAWNGNQRVTALKKAIMCAKMLADTRTPSFYPSMYVLISNIMDAFCELVRQRLTGRSDEFTAVKLSRVSFLPSDVAPEAKETCRNWFFKIACIRELLPRILVEAALVPNYRFLDTGSYPRILSRLAHSVRGLGDPLIALHVRLYVLCVCVCVCVTRCVSLSICLFCHLNMFTQTFFNLYISKSCIQTSKRHH